MTYLAMQIQTPDDFINSQSFDGEARVTLSNPDAENGFPVAGGASWLNSASVEVSAENDEVTFTASVGDPRGAFVFRIRRLQNGKLLIHTPYPGESFAHMATAEMGPGTLMVEGDHSDYYEQCGACGELYAKDDMNEDGDCCDCAESYGLSISRSV
jgi:hypothetical protein